MPSKLALKLPEDYVENLVRIFRDVRRVLRDDGTLWLNVGDGYARNGGTGKSGPNAQVGNTRKLIQRRNCEVPDCWGLKDRDLMGLPWRVAFALQADGWLLRSRITWVKKAPMPESVRNRPSNATEDVFLLSKTPNVFLRQSSCPRRERRQSQKLLDAGARPRRNVSPRRLPQRTGPPLRAVEQPPWRFGSGPLFRLRNHGRCGRGTESPSDSHRTERNLRHAVQSAY